MIKFDSNHTLVEGNVNERQGKKIGKKILASGLIVANLFTFSACAKETECDIPVEHAHYYTDEYDFGRYIVSEKNTVDGLTKTDNYIEITKEDEALLRYINKMGLYRIDENYETIKEVEDSCHDYTEYLNEEPALRPILTPKGFRLFPLPKEKWSDSQNNTSTGETRNCHYMFYGYKVINKGNGKYQIERSDFVDSFDDLPPEYEYVSKNFAVVSNDYDNHTQLTDIQNTKAL